MNMSPLLVVADVTALTEYSFYPIMIISFASS